MKKLNKYVGNYGENLAVQFLIDNNYNIIQKNFSCKYGEIDIIALNENTLCFIEVKSRFSLEYGYPSEAVTTLKINKIYRTAEFFIFKNNLYDINCRFDVIEIFLNYNDTDVKFNLLKNII